MNENSVRVILDWSLGIAGYGVIWLAVAWQSDWPSFFSAQGMLVAFGGILLRFSAMSKWMGK